MASFRKLIISGSNGELNNLRVTNSISASFFTGSFVGDGSLVTGVVSASYAISASYAPGSPSVSASYAPDDRSFGITIDGGGSVITTGIKGDITIPFNGTINSWYLVADQAGSIVIDVWKDTFANFPPTVLDTISGAEKPTLLAATSNSNVNLTTWTTSVTIGDVVRFNVDSILTITRVTLVIKVRT